MLTWALVGAPCHAVSRYLFSDGLADDQMQCIDFVEGRVAHGHRVPVIHAVRKYT